jgi:LPPG:FO 2-phospho-L-lactate transferase
MALKIVALTGGVGGSKLADGLATVLPHEHLTLIVNTADDFEHVGLIICPDVDTVIYTLAGVANPQTGWGRANETWSFMQALEELGGPTWFQLGDRDLAVHVERTRRLREGQALSLVIEHIRRSLGVSVRILPMSDQPVRTIVLTEEGELPFQRYFVERKCEPRVTGFRYAGIETALPGPGVLDAIAEADAVVFCPSNPWVSLDPILSVRGIREAVQAKPVLGVSPIVGGKAIKGPAAKMYKEMGIQPSAITFTEHYHDLLSGVLIDAQDEGLLQTGAPPEVHVRVTNTIMKDREDRKRLAAEVLAFCTDELLIGAPA